MRPRPDPGNEEANSAEVRGVLGRFDLRGGKAADEAREELDRIDELSPDDSERRPRRAHPQDIGLGLRDGIVR